ncbi:GNAT family N-acetyltransferase [Tropicimonas sp. IMCC34043]|uniref:GNAT family N-acetyltransferase n=1 Tax=Tropicimonas sp. IMCC34043 TaxID=2248760 RepID=UPI000E289A10|nr:GNAT family N-acetyltransferase [Tropicimonas sp. IMCC34043]
MAETRLRPAGAGDLDAINALIAAAFAPYVPRIGRKPAPMVEDYAALTAAGLVQVLVRGPAVEGILVLIDQDDHLLLDVLAVAPEAQGQGIGRRLIAEAERQARHRGHDILRLLTNEAMVEPLALYRRVGFVETHRSTESGFRRVYLEKRLA